MNEIKKIAVLSFAIFFAAQTFAQSDDIPDSRRKTESFERFHNNEIRAELATFTLAGIGEGAPTTPLTKVTFTSLGKDSIVIEGSGIKAKIKTAPFDPAKHKLNYDDKTLVRIDRRPYYGGAYGKVPKTEISSVVLIIRGDTIDIPATAYNDLYNLNFNYTDKGVERTTDAVYITVSGTRVYLYLYSRDRVGSYEVTWIIQDRRYLRRILDYDIM
jgi:hypothetical protein